MLVCFLFLEITVHVDVFCCVGFDEVLDNGVETEVAVEVDKAVDIDATLISFGHKL